MGIKSSADITRIVKEQWDKSKDKADWRVLSGRNYKGRYDMFISSPERIWQLKFVQTGNNEVTGFGMDVGKMDDDIGELMKIGAPVPFGLISPQKVNLAIIMAGVQQYSSETTHTFCTNYVSDAQAKLDEKLDREIAQMSSNDPVFRRRYREQKERESRPYL